MLRVSGRQSKSIESRASKSNIFGGLSCLFTISRLQPIRTLRRISAYFHVINIISPTDTPLIAALGGISGARSKFKIRENGYKIEILEDELPQTSDTLAVAMTTSATSLTVADASIFQPGDVILIDAEYMVVSAVDVTTNVVTVFSRAYGH